MSDEVRNRVIVDDESEQTVFTISELIQGVFPHLAHTCMRWKSINVFT